MDYFDPQPTGEPWYPIPPDPDEQDDDDEQPDAEDVLDCWRSF